MSEEQQIATWAEEQISRHRSVAEYYRKGNASLCDEVRWFRAERTRLEDQVSSARRWCAIGWCLLGLALVVFLARSVRP